MSEEELKQLEENLKAKEDELQKKEGELQKKEEELKQREDDAEKIGSTIRDTYEERLNKQSEVYEQRLKARDEVIKQLSAGEEKAPAAPSFIERMNEKRQMQNKKW